MGETGLDTSRELNLAVKKHTEGKLHEAELIYRKILAVYPNNPDALHLLGVIAHQVGRHEDAVKCISQAIKINPNDAVYHHNLGMAYDSLGEEEKSAKNFEKALNLNPNFENAHLACYNLGIFFKDKGEIEKSLEYFTKAIKLKKDFFEARWNRSLILLLLGKFKEGWEEYEYRFKKENPADSRIFNKPQWDGSFLNNKKILVVSEQGFGDNIQFVRYLPLVKEKGGYVILEYRKELKRLFNNLQGVDEFAEKESNPSSKIDFDFYIHLASLPKVFNTAFNTIPDKTPYFKANTPLQSNLKNMIHADKFKIGIAWAGNPNQENDKNRSTTFENFKFLKEIPDLQVFSLQKGEASKELNNDFVVNLEDEIRDFADTASVIENLDLVISVDTSVAHLAGAMGKPVWTLLTFIPDWRWMLKGNKNPWYPTMRLFRQQKQGDWDYVFKEVNRELRNYLRNLKYTAENSSS